MTWNEYTATLTEDEHTRLVVAMGRLLTAARLASEVATSNGDVEEAKRQILRASRQGVEVMKIMFGPVPA